MSQCANEVHTKTRRCSLIQCVDYYVACAHRRKGLNRIPNVDCGFVRIVTLQLSVWISENSWTNWPRYFCSILNSKRPAKNTQANIDLVVLAPLILQLLCSGSVSVRVSNFVICTKYTLRRRSQIHHLRPNDNSFVRTNGRFGDSVVRIWIGKFGTCGPIRVYREEFVSHPNQGIRFPLAVVDRIDHYQRIQRRQIIIVVDINKRSSVARYLTRKGPRALGIYPINDNQRVQRRNVEVSVHVRCHQRIVERHDVTRH